jgi:hypothetical protein
MSAKSTRYILISSARQDASVGSRPHLQRLSMWQETWAETHSVM